MQLNSGLQTVLTRNSNAAGLNRELKIPFFTIPRAKIILCMKLLCVNALQAY